MRFWLYILGAATVFAGAGMVVSATKAQSANKTQSRAAAPAEASVGDAYQFRMKAIDGKPLDWAQFRRQVMLVVNTASFCGFTPQYKGLQALHTRYADQGFTVLGVPSGDFGGQEHESNAEIAQFCESTFGITFPMTEKSHVKGAEAAPFYQWARTQLPRENEPKWNFHKFLVGKDGRIIAGFGSRVTPDSPELKRAIEQALAA